MKDERIKVIIVEPWNDMKLASRVAEEAGAHAVVLAAMVGGVKGADSYIDAIDHNVTALAQALR
jgi:ABC-type Zn uptake system ZnuABC Zn-binding protein ZnuA